MPENKPIVTQIGNDYNKPRVTQIDQKTNWSFSFEYFNQMKYFGLDRIPQNWFISFVERLKDLSSKTRSDFFSDKNTRQFYRYHKIDWQAKSIPVSRKDFNWISKEYLDNEDDFPFYQFGISKALGRVVGFWNENHSIFYIVALDPHHNIQPSKYNDYKVNDCYPLSCQFTSLQSDIDKIKAFKPNCDSCTIKDSVLKLPTGLNKTNALISFLEDDYKEELEKAISKGNTFSEIIKLGIIEVMK